MTIYFESINDWGSIQISDSFSNYVLWGKGEAYSGVGQASYSQRWRLSIPTTSSGARAIIALTLPPGVAPLTLVQSFSGTHQSLDIYSSDVYTQGQKITYYVFVPSDDPSVNLEPAKGMFCIWNEAGRLIYDSEAYYLKVLDYVEHRYDQGLAAKTHPGVTRLGLVVSQAQWFVAPGGGPGGGWGALAGTSAYVDPDKPNRIVFDYMPFRRTTSGSQWPDPAGPTNTLRPPMCKMLVCDLSKLDELPITL